MNAIEDGLKKNLKTLGLLGVLAFCFILVCSCKSEESEVSEDIKQFFELPVREQHESISRFEIEKQYDIYIYSMTRRHPPDLGFAYDLASERERVVPFLMENLRQTEEESIQEKIIYVFAVMTWAHGMNLNDDEELIKLIHEVVASMTNDYYKGLSQQYVREIEGGPDRRND